MLTVQLLHPQHYIYFFFLKKKKTGKAGALPWI